MEYQILPLKTTDELLQWIFDNYDVAPLPLSTFSKNFMHNFEFTIVHSVNHELNPTPSDKLNFIAYRLLPTERNQKYFNTHYAEYLGDLIYLILETENKCHTSNSFLFDLEVHRAWGLSESDIKNRTILYKQYIWVLDSLAELEAK